MKWSISSLIAGAFGLVVLCAVAAASYIQGPRSSATKNRSAFGAPISERQALERRRGNIGIVATAETAVK